MQNATHAVGRGTFSLNGVALPIVLSPKIWNVHRSQPHSLTKSPLVVLKG